MLYESCGDRLESLVTWHEPLRYPNDCRCMNCPEHSVARSPCFTAGISPGKKIQLRAIDYGLLHFTAQASTLRAKAIGHPKVKSIFQNAVTEPGSGSQFPTRGVIPAHIKFDSGKIVSEMPVPHSLFAPELEKICEFILLSKDHEVEKAGPDETSHSRDNSPRTPESRPSLNLNIILIMWCKNRICEWAWEEAGAKEKILSSGNSDFHRT